MKLTLKTDYALRTLIYLGWHQQQLVSIAEVARFHGISQNHLVKVVHELGRRGFIETLRGKGGGIRLAPHSLQCRLGDIVRAMEDELAVVPCLREPPATQGHPPSVDQPADAGACRLTGNCRLQGILHGAMARFMAELDSHTLGDLVAPQPDASDAASQSLQTMFWSSRSVPGRDPR